MHSSTIHFLRTVIPSLIVTPWLLFVTTSSNLYLRNQADLHGQFEVLYPFLGAALLIFLFGVLLAVLATRYESFHLPLWAYYLLAPLFFILQSINAWEKPAFELPLSAIAVFFYLIACIVLNRKLTLQTLAPVFTVAGLALVLTDAYLFASKFKHAESEQHDASQISTVDHSRTDRPNIYHLVLDEYQTDMFALTLSNEVKRKLAGFTFYEQATTVFGRTEMSLPSVFSGKNYDFQSSPLDYQKAAFSPGSSILGPLRESGYETRAIMFPVFSFKLEGFDHVKFHPPVKEKNYLRAVKSFFKVWVFSVLPTRASELVLDTKDVDQLKHRTLLPVVAPVESYESMLNVMASEKYLRGRNRYQFIHLLIPHFPYVLSKDCLYQSNQKTSPTEQSHCATALIISFVDTLKQLDRFDESLIIVQSDHGSRFKMKGGKLKGIGETDTVRFGTEYSKARARSLLLIKPAGMQYQKSLVTSSAPVSLMDIAPTIIESLDVTTSLEFDGRSLLGVDPHDDTPRVRYYYFYNKVGSQGRHIIKMTRFKIEATGLVDEGLVGTGEFK